MITVFTPTYNRAYILPKLYGSLQRQTCKGFEWIIVDDGSTDDTEKIVYKWLEKSSFEIRYERRENGGKHRAINRGVKIANGDFFFIVDSDDYLPDNAIEVVSRNCEKIKDREDIAGVIGFRVNANGDKINRGNFGDELICNVIDYQYRHHGVGDMAEAYRTSILKEFPFPDIEGERFCTESLIWNRIGCKYKVLFFNEGVYVCNYLADGLTAKMMRLRHQNPVYATTFYSEALQLDMPFMDKLRNAINYWRFYFDKPGKRKPRISLKWLGVMPIGLIINIMERL